MNGREYIYIQTPPPCQGRRPRPRAARPNQLLWTTRVAARRRLGQALPPAAICPPPLAAAAAAAAADVLLLFRSQATATSSARRAPPPAAPVTAGHPASSSLETSILPPGPATRGLPSPKATRLRWAELTEAEPTGGRRQGGTLVLGRWGAPRVLPPRRQELFRSVAKAVTLAFWDH
jgi:hypothetical protein